MADRNKLTAQVRTQFGKGAARKIRAAHKIPAVLYGHGSEPQHLTLPGHETALLIRKANALIELDVEGTPQLALVKDVQRDPVRLLIEHLDLVLVRSGEKVVVDVPVHVEGESASGTIAALDASTISVEADATRIPERITLSIEGLPDGTQIHARDLELPAGTTLAADPDVLIVAISQPGGGPSGGGDAEETGTGSPSDDA